MQKIVLPAFVCLMLCVRAEAQTQNFLDHITAEAGAGFSFPVGTIANHAKNGFHFAAAGGPRLNQRWSITLDFSLHYMDAKNLPRTDTTDLSLGSMVRTCALTVNPVYEFIKQERFSSYATGGYGLYNRTLLLAAPGPLQASIRDEFWNVSIIVPEQTITGDRSVYKGGYNVGGGVTFGPHVKLFAEARYHHMFTSKGATEFFPVTFGIRW